MLEGWDIIALTYSDWEAAYSTPHHLMGLLALCNRILWVDVPRSFLYGLKPRRFRHNDTWTGPPLRTVRENLHVFHPKHRFMPVGHLPFRVARRALHANGRMLARGIQRTAKDLGFKPGLVWSFSPLHGGAVAHLDRRLLIHDICDEWSNYIDYNAGKRIVEWMDQRLTSQADISFVFSGHMKSRRAGLNDALHVVYPAGDVPHYSTAASPETVVPAEIAALPKPVIGAICVVEPARFDAQLLVHLAKARPDWSLVVVGPVRAGVDFREIQKHPNIHILGDRPRATLPAYLKGFDAALVPYALNDATRGIYPMKLHEYLAGGKPVVCPALPACFPLAPVVRFARTHNTFVNEIDQALATDSAEAQARRMKLAANNSWANRLDERCEIIAKTLAAKSPEHQLV